MWNDLKMPKNALKLIKLKKTKIDAITHNNITHNRTKQCFIEHCWVCLQNVGNHIRSVRVEFSDFKQTASDRLISRRKHRPAAKNRILLGVDVILRSEKKKKKKTTKMYCAFGNPRGIKKHVLQTAASLTYQR